MSEPLVPDARAGDADRKRTAERLKGALDEGRLDLTEYDERLQKAYVAKTYRELDELVADIPGVAPISESALERSTGDEPVAAGTGRGSKMRDIKKTWASFGGAAIFFTGLWAIGWVASGSPPNFWPVWVLGIWGVIALCQTWSTLMRD